MARFTSLIGKRVQVNYRAADILLSAVGALAADSGQSVYVEEHFVQRGNSKTLRTEIPYACIVGLAEAAETPVPNQTNLRTTNANPQTISPAQS
jgi:hypothetical protein